MIYMYLKFLLKTKGVKGVDIFLNDNFSYCSKFSKKNFTKFVKLYLNKPFDNTNPYPYAILKYIRLKGLSITLEDISSSNYFESMPSANVIDAMHYAYVPENESSAYFNYLISKLDEKDIMRLPEVQSIIRYFEKELPALLDKLQDCKNIDLIISLFSSLDIKDKYNIINSICQNYSLEEIKRFALSLNSFQFIGNIIYHLLDNGKAKDVIDIIIDLDKRDFKAISEFVGLFNDNYPNKEHITLLAEEILKSDNFDLMYSWVMNIKCDKNYEIIDKILLSNLNLECSSLGDIVLELDCTYAEYVVRKICDEMEVQKLEELVESITDYLDARNIERIDFILSLIFYLRPAYIMPEDQAMELLKHGTKYYRAILEKYEFSLEERQLILSNLHLNNRYDLIAIYGSYLLSGDQNKLVDEPVITNNTTTLKRLRAKK